MHAAGINYLSSSFFLCGLFNVSHHQTGLSGIFFEYATDDECIIRKGMLCITTEKEQKELYAKVC